MPRQAKQTARTSYPPVAPAIRSVARVNRARLTIFLNSLTCHRPAPQERMHRSITSSNAAKRSASSRESFARQFLVTLKRCHAAFQ